MSKKPDIFTPQDENLFYRAVTERHGIPAKAAVDDFLNTGQIRGTQRYGSEAYFSRGAYWDPAKQWTVWGAAPDSPSEIWPGHPRSYQITVDPTKVNASTNPLYGKEAGWKNKYFDNPKDFPIIANPTSGGQATYPVLQPAKDPGLLSTINPKNRSGIKIVGNTGEIVYDRVTPVSERPFSTNVANAKAEAKIIGNALGKGAGKVANTAGRVAGPAFIAYDAYTKAQEGRARGDDPKIMGSTYTTDAVLNFVTLGGSDFAKWYYLATPEERDQHWHTVGERLQREAESGWTY